jgi:esterase/lipase superfamily enzyme
MFKGSYIITNRSNVAATTYTDINPLDGGKMWFYRAEVADRPYVCDSSLYKPFDTTPSTTASAFYQAALVNDLRATADAKGTAHLCVFIQGLGNLFDKAVPVFATMGNYLAAYGGYTGLVIGFDWPSFNGKDSVDHYASTNSFPPTATSGTVRDNINGSADAFVNFMKMLQTINATLNNRLEVDVICHSEGNYMMMRGMRAVADAGLTGSLPIKQVMLCAADINNAALGVPTTDQFLGPYVGWGSNIATNADRVTVYYSANDAALQASDKLFIAHNKQFPHRLGLKGPYDARYLEKNVVPVDCSNVVNQAEVKTLGPLGYVPASFWDNDDDANGSTHVLYMYTPQILQDLAQTMAGTAADQVPNRTRTGDGWYTMQPAPQPPQATTKPCPLPNDG